MSRLSHTSALNDNKAPVMLRCASGYRPRLHMSDKPTTNWQIKIIIIIIFFFFFFFFFFYKKPVTLICCSDTHRGELVVPAATPHARGVSNYWVRESCALSRRNEPRMMAFCILPAKISAEFRHAGMIFSSDSSVCLIPPRAPIISTTILTVWSG